MIYESWDQVPGRENARATGETGPVAKPVAEEKKPAEPIATGEAPIAAN